MVCEYWACNAVCCYVVQVSNAFVMVGESAVLHVLGSTRMLLARGTALVLCCMLLAGVAPWLPVATFSLLLLSQDTYAAAWLLVTSCVLPALLLAGRLQAKSPGPPQASAGHNPQGGCCMAAAGAAHDSAACCTQSLDTQQCI